MVAHIIALASDPQHRMSKQARSTLELVAGLGVEGDAHAGATVQHLSRIAKDPSVPNLRQVHLIHAELFEELVAKGFAVGPGAMGENITTRGIDLLGLSRGTRLQVGSAAVIEVTGLRNPCYQLNSLKLGLMDAVLACASDGTLIRKAGIMAVVVESGTLRCGDPIRIVSLPAEHEALLPV